MLKRCVAMIAPILSLAIAVPVAQAAPKSHHLKLTIKDSTITSQGDSPGNKQTTAGLVKGNPFGRGVESISDKVTNATSTAITFNGTITIYTAQGTLTGTVKFKITPAPNGSATGTGSGKITNGTGRYKGAHGKVNFTGAQAANSSVFVSHATGTVSY
jgi:hypothetical protein